MRSRGGELPGFTMPNGQRMLSTTEAAQLWTEIMGAPMSKSTYWRMLSRGEIEALGILTSAEGQKYTDLDSLIAYFQRHAREIAARADTAMKARRRDLRAFQRRQEKEQS